MTTAEQIIVAVAKHDEGAARVMIADCAEQNLSEARGLYMGPVLDAVIRELDDVRPGLIQRVGKSYVTGGATGPVDTAVLEDLDALVAVCKASQTEHWVDRGGERHRITAMRDERGRFSAKPGKGISDPGSWTNTGSGQINAAPSNVQSQLFDSDKDKARGEFQSDAGSTDEKRKVTEYLGRVREVRSILRDLKQNVGSNSDLKLRIEFESPDADPVMFNAGQEVGQVEWDVGHGAPDRYTAVTPGNMSAEDTTGVAQAMGAGGAQGLGMNEVRHYANELLDQKNLEESGAGKAQKLANAGSQLAGLVGLKGLAGTLKTGSQALRVAEEMRPTLARAAYRYRGTERVPERGVVEAATFTDLPPGETKFIDALRKAPVGRFSGKNGEWLNENYAADVGGQMERTRDLSGIGALAADRVAQFEADRFEGPISNQRLLMAVQRDRVGQELLKRVVQREASGAGKVGTRREGTASMNSLVDQIASGIGRGLPSEGVLIDDKGEVVAQSVGMGGDNYQPFTAAALGKLNGGQYVRTRNSGGVSPDDVRTLLISGGRAGLIVSPAGIFDFEFDPRFRGSKRFSDKSLQMIDTYTRILDQLAAKNIYAKDLPAEIESEVTEEAVRMSGVQPGQDGYKVHYDRIRDSKRIELSRITSDQRRKLKAEAQEGGGSETEVETRFKEMVKAQQDENVRALSLNGEGYAVALRSLQEFYPYWIRSATRRDPSALGVGDAFDKGARAMLDRMSAGTDKEYVAPGKVRPGTDKNAVTGRPKPFSATVAADEERKAKADDDKGEKPSVPGGSVGTDSVSELDGSEEKKAATGPEKAAHVEGPPLAAAIASGGKKARAKAYDEAVGAADKSLNDALLGNTDAITTRTDLLNNESDDGASTNASKRFKRNTVSNGNSLLAAVSDTDVFKLLVDQFKDDAAAAENMTRHALSALKTQSGSAEMHEAAEGIVSVARNLSVMGLKWEEVNDGFDGSPQKFGFLNDVDSLEKAKALDSTSEYIRFKERAKSPGLESGIPIADQAKTLRGYRKFLDFVAENSSELSTATDSMMKLRLEGHGNKKVVSEIIGKVGDSKSAANMRRIAMNPSVLEDRFKAAKAVFSANYLKAMAEGLSGVGSPKVLAPLGLNKVGEIQKSAEDDLVDFSQMTLEEVLQMAEETK